jgi:hypothetical protein
MAPLRTAGLAFKSDTLLRTPIARLLKPSSRCVLKERTVIKYLRCSCVHTCVAGVCTHELVRAVQRSFLRRLGRAA